ncbi:HEAT repeat domain-containing protein [Streptomyces collinus]|uniref:HEAT repeat domain-containing protein n=1 Tax=Streptomyces collinus TaxID=42684 RepID=UPI0038257329
MTGQEPVARVQGPAKDVQAKGDRAISVGTSAGNVISGDHSTIVDTLIVTQNPTPPSTPSEDEIDAAVVRYAGRIAQVYGRLDLEVLTPLSEEHPAVELREVFVAPTVRADPPPVELPRELLRRLAKSGEADDGPALPLGVDESAIAQIRDSYLRRPPLEVLKVLAAPASRLLVLLGDPGAGKSTLVRYLTLALSQGRAEGPLSGLANYVPLLVELRQYADERWRHSPFADFLTHLHDDFALSVPPAVANELLLNERALVVFDGLDELFDRRVRDDAAQRIAAFATRWPTARIVVTSRTIGYRRGSLEAAGFAHFMLQELDESRISEFIRGWYRIACPGNPRQAEELVKRIDSALRASGPLREMAGNPLLLTVLAIVGRRQQLPNKRHRLYEHAVTVLVSEWDRTAKQLSMPLPATVSEVLELLGPDERLELLRLLARTMQEGQDGIAGNHIARDRLIAVFRSYLRSPQFELSAVHAEAVARAMVAQLHERNFILCHYGGEVYGFVHRVFLEYLAAADLAYRYKDDREWTPAELVDQVIAPRACDPSWHEVLLLLMGQIGTPAARAAIDGLLGLQSRAAADDASHAALALRALAEVGHPGDLSAQSRSVVDYATRALDIRGRKGPYLLEEAMPALASFSRTWTGQSCLVRWFGLSGQFSSSEEPTLVVGTLRLPAANFSLLATRSYYEVDRVFFLYLWGEQHPDDSVVHELLVHTASHETLEHVRSTALEALVELWPRRDDVRELLMTSAVEDPAVGTRYTALRLLGATWLENADTSALIERAAAEDPEDFHRIGLLEALAAGAGDRADIRGYLMRRALADNQPYVRRAALRVLGERCSDRDDVRDFVIRRLTDSSSSDDFVSAARVLAKYWTADPQVRDVLLRETAGPNRLGAVSTLGYEWPHDERVRQALVNASSDPEPAVRKVALERLGRSWRHDEETHEIILRRAASDPDDDIRCTAIRLLDRTLDTDGTYAALLTVAGEAEGGARDDALKQLALHWPDFPEVRDLMLRSIHQNLSAYTGALLLKALQANWPDRHDVHALLLRAAAHPEKHVRAAFLDVLSDTWPESDDVLAVLLRAAQEPEDIYDARRSALRLLTRRWFDRDEVREVVARAAVDPDAPYSASAVLNVLADHWFWHDRAKNLLLHAATHHPDEQTRLAAVRTLGLRRPDDPDVLAVFLKLATADSAPSVRFTALTRWALHTPDDDVRVLTVTRACAEPDAETRSMVHHMLALSWPTHSDTLSVLQDRAAHDPDEETRARAARLLIVPLVTM